MVRDIFGDDGSDESDGEFEVNTKTICRNENAKFIVNPRVLVAMLQL